MKSLVVALAILLAVPATFAANQDNTELVMEIVQQAGLEDKMSKDQANDLVSLRKALLKAARLDSDAKGYMVAANEEILPAVAKIANEAQREYEQTVVQYNLILIASENGYEENGN